MIKQKKGIQMPESNEIISEFSTIHSPSVYKAILTLVLSEIIISLCLLLMYVFLGSDSGIAFKIITALLATVFIYIALHLAITTIMNIFNKKYKYIITQTGLLIIHNRSTIHYLWEDIRKDFRIQFFNDSFDINLYSLNRSTYGYFFIHSIPYKKSSILQDILKCLNCNLEYELIQKDLKINSFYYDNVKKFYNPIFAVIVIAAGIIWVIFALFMDFVLMKALYENFSVTLLLFNTTFFFHFIIGIAFLKMGIDMLRDNGMVYINETGIIIKHKLYGTRIIDWSELKDYSDINYSKLLNRITIVCSKIYFRSGLALDRIQLYGLKNPQKIINAVKERTQVFETAN